MREAARRGEFEILYVHKDGSLWNVFHLAILIGRKSTSDRLTFEVLLAERNGSGGLVHQKIQLWAVIVLNDEASPVITIGFPEDF